MVYFAQWPQAHHHQVVPAGVCVPRTHSPPKFLINIDFFLVLADDVVRKTKRMLGAVGGFCLSIPDWGAGFISEPYLIQHMIPKYRYFN